MTGHELATLSRTLITTLAQDNGWEGIENGNVLITQDYVRGISALHTTKLERMVLTLPAKKWDSNEQFYTDSSGKRALKKHALDQMGYLAGVRWLHSGPIGAQDNPDYLMWQATGAIRGMNGEWYSVTKTREWQYEVEREKVLARAAVLTRGWDDEKREATSEEKQAYIVQECARLREHRATMAESKAQNRVARAILGVPASAPDVYWKRPFFIPRTDPLLDPSDPDVRAAILADAHGAGGRLGVTIPAVPAEVPTEVHEIDGKPVEVIEVSEVQRKLTPAEMEAAAARADAEFPLPPKDPLAELFGKAGEFVINIGVSADTLTLQQAWDSEQYGPDYVRRLQQLPGGGEYDQIINAVCKFVTATNYQEQ